MKKIAFILLAAGNSTRFGADKLIARLENQQTVLETVGRQLLNISDELIAVINTNNPQREKILTQLKIPIHICQQAKQGMGLSLASAIRATADYDGWVICLADMPYINNNTFNIILTAMQQGAMLAAPYYHHQRGHPVGINQHYKAELLKLKGDEGAKAIIKQNINKLVRIETNDSGILKDIDKPTDLY